MRYVKVPAPIRIYDPATGKPLFGDTTYSLRDFVINLLEDRQLYADHASMLIAQKILDSCPHGWEVGMVWALEDDRWLRLKRAVEHPTAPAWGVSPVVARSYFPMADAILNATESPPDDGPILASENDD